jgi:hypothetical protein
MIEAFDGCLRTQSMLPRLPEFLGKTNDASFFPKHLFQLGWEEYVNPFYVVLNTGLVTHDILKITQDQVLALFLIIISSMDCTDAGVDELLAWWGKIGIYVAHNGNKRPHILIKVFRLRGTGQIFHRNLIGAPVR